MSLKGLLLYRTDLIRLKGHGPSSSFRLFPLIVSYSLQNFFILSVKQKDFLCRSLRASVLVVENAGVKFESAYSLAELYNVFILIYYFQTSPWYWI